MLSHAGVYLNISYSVSKFKSHFEVTAFSLRSAGELKCNNLLRCTVDLNEILFLPSHGPGQEVLKQSDSGQLSYNWTQTQQTVYAAVHFTSNCNNTCITCRYSLKALLSSQLQNIITCICCYHNFKDRIQLLSLLLSLSFDVLALVESIRAADKFCIDVF